MLVLTEHVLFDAHLQGDLTYSGALHTFSVYNVLLEEVNVDGHLHFSIKFERISSKNLNYHCIHM